MSLESFRELCEKGKFYYFKSVHDFDKKIDWNGTHLKGVTFNNGIEDARHYPPGLWSAYGTTK